jgi:hypothetical protein
MFVQQVHSPVGYLALRLRALRVGDHVNGVVEHLVRDTLSLLHIDRTCLLSRVSCKANSMTKYPRYGRRDGRPT